MRQIYFHGILCKYLEFYNNGTEEVFSFKTLFFDMVATIDYVFSLVKTRTI